MSTRRALPRLQPDRLRQLTFFREFTPEEIRHLLAVGVAQTYDDGELLATEGTRKQRRVLYVVLQGELHYVKRIRAGRAGVVMVLRPGDVGGFLTFLNDDPSPVSVRSVGRTTVFEMGRREMQALGSQEADLAVKLLRTLLGVTARRLDDLLDRVAATSAWALDLERHLRALPLLPGINQGT
jgi:CRP-like cAMP-binding protein